MRIGQQMLASAAVPLSRALRSSELVGIVFLILSVATGILGADPVHFTGISPSAEAVFLYGSFSRIAGQLAQPADEVAVYSASGVLCGAAVVEMSGAYTVAVYRDDDDTPTVEGAVQDEALFFRVWDADTDREYAEHEVHILFTEKQDGSGQPYWTSDRDAYQVEFEAVPNDHAPVIADTARSIDEDAENGAGVGARIPASDADGDSLSFEIVSGNASGAFAIDSGTGQITVADTSSLDHATMPEVALGIRVSDGYYTDSATVTVTVRPSRHFTGIHAASEMAFLFGSESTIRGQMITVDDEIGVYTESGILCGAARVDNDGAYAVAVYHDDMVTAEIVDGALTGEKLFLHIWDSDEKREYSGTEVIYTYLEKQDGSGAPYWTSNNDVYRVEVKAATVPAVTTAAVTVTDSTSASCGGEVTSDGSSAVSAKGVCWGLSSGPTVDLYEGITSDGTGTGAFTSALTGLTAGSTYYVRAYATNDVGTVYGEERVFSTSRQDQTITFPELPVKTFGDADFAPGASTTSGLTVSYASDTPSVATIVEGKIHITGAGTSTITASQAGNTEWNAATPVSRILTVNKAAAQVTLSDLVHDYDGMAKSATVTTDPAGLTLTVTYDGSETAPTVVGNYAVSATVVDANYTGDASDTLTIVGQPEINVQGSGYDILSGDSDPWTSDGTDFDEVSVAGGQATATFVIQNTGSADLDLLGGAVVALSDTTHFTVTVQPSVTTIGAGASSSFELTFDPDSIGEKLCVVTITSNDEDEPDYTFSIGGTGISLPGAPDTPTYSDVSSTSLIVYWSAPSVTGGTAIISYRLEKLSPGGSWEDVYTGSAFSFVAGSLTEETEYSFRVSALNTVGWGPASPASTVTTVTDHISQDLHFFPGWNLTAFKMDPEISDPQAMFHEHDPSSFDETVWGWNAEQQSYFPVTVLKGGEGYWVHVSGSDEVTLTDVAGVPVATTSVAIEAGWNLVGPLGEGEEREVPLDAGIESDNIYEWDASQRCYAAPLNLISGKGYWIRGLMATQVDLGMD